MNNHLAKAFIGTGAISTFRSPHSYLDALLEAKAKMLTELHRQRTVDTDDCQLDVLRQAITSCKQEITRISKLLGVSC